MFYPMNLFGTDPTSGSIRPFIIFLAFELQPNIMKAKSWSDEMTVKVPKGGFALPMPNGGLVDSVTNDYSNTAGIGGNISKKAINTLNSGIEGASMGIVDNATGRMGIVPDPKFTQIYGGTSPRQWSGTWQIVPQSMGESAMVALILAFIKQAAAPDKADMANKVGVLIQPYVFKIVFSNPVIHLAMQFDQMAITGYSINYFAQGYASTYNDMMPKKIELTMNFAEFGIKTRKDWSI
jgi:hypothetical protein